ncbi:MAG: family 78 glycoside hydrolase catalytic domain [Verrucomicrobia bacterium]|nr:family 78 glycoside hydrolase catalytic domain [Verrucomicrobiota bacterium]
MNAMPRILVFTLLLALAVTTGRASTTATDLRCEYQRDPVAVDVPAPRLSWVLESDTRGALQTAYQILVASSADRLRRDECDLWDSGKVVSSEQNQIAYAGRPLAADTECFWKVRVWDNGGEVSGWSEPARWGVGLPKPSDWDAKWIGMSPQAGARMEGCPWVWFPEANPAENAPAGKRHFRKLVQVPAGTKATSAILLATADNRMTAYVNGRKAGEANAWENLHRFDLTNDMASGSNALAIEAENTIPSPAGLIGKLFISLDNGTTLAIPVDATWRCSDRPIGGWTKLDFDDRGWLTARELGAFGMEPWGRPPVPQAGLPMFRRAFMIEKPLRRAVVHICGLGHHDLFLNGRKVGDHFLDPAWSVFEKTQFYSSHDITAQLRSGCNVLGVMLGKGFYNTEGDRRVHGVNANRPLKLILQAHLFFTDATEQVVTSDANWRAISGPITHSAMLGGEDYDARLMPDGWTLPAYDDSLWQRAVETDGPDGNLHAAISPPLGKHDIFKPIRIDEPAPGVFVYDFGQNASAIPSLRVRGKAGQKIRLSPAEQRHGSAPRRNDGRGLVNPAGVGQPNYWEYTLRGGTPESWSPQFNYSGFQYIQIVGAVPQGRANPANLPVIEELVSVHVRNAVPTVGRFECSDRLFNAIDRNIDWAVKSNLSHVLTDCPHREKLGWLEVSYLMGPSIAGRYDISRFYSKIACDCRESQRPDGMVPTVAPAYPAFSGGFDYTPEWGAASVIIPWQVHQWYGDTAVLAANYEAMRGYVEYMRVSSTDLVPKPGLGDWYDYNAGGSNGPSQFTPAELSAMATFYRCAKIVADTAGLLGKQDEQNRFGELASRIRDAFNARFFDGKGEYKNSGSPQCANSMALALGMVPQGHEQAVLERIIADLRARKNQQTAGDIGFVYLIETLVKFGRHDVLCDIVSRTDMGSYGFIINNGWTAMPEAWDANTTASMNHCMLGHIQQWFLGSVAGIRPDPLAPGFARFSIAPEPVGTLTWARGEYQSIRGRIASAWKTEGEMFRLSVVIPPNTSAIVTVPAARPGDVRESGKPAAGSPGVKFLRHENGKTVFEVCSGRYDFSTVRR